MSDSGFREIQLSGKHVVFLFIAGAVASVAIFLLGVSVGRGVARPDTAAQATPVPADAVTGAVQPATLPPPTTPAPGELQYYGTLQGKGDAKSPVPTPTPSPSASPAASPTASPVKPAPSPAPASKPDASAPAASSADAVWYVQVNSFTSRDNAARQVTQLKAKGITAEVSVGTGSGPRYKVRVGPLDKAAADAMMARLRKEGFKPSLTR